MAKKVHLWAVRLVFPFEILFKTKINYNTKTGKVGVIRHCWTLEEVSVPFKSLDKNQSF